MISYIPHKNKKHNWQTTVFILVVVFFSGVIAYVVTNYPKIFKTNISLAQNNPVDFTQPIKIVFSYPVIPSSIEHSLNIAPEQNFQFSWENKNRELIITPEKYWQPESEYIITIAGGKNIFLANLNATLHFLTKSYPIITSVAPANGEKNVEITMEDPITFTFDYSLNDYDVKFEANPQKQLEIQLSDDKKTIRLVSQDDFAKNTKYDISVFLKFKLQSENEYHKIKETSFSTAAPPSPIERNKNPATRLAEAMLYTNPQILSGKYIDVDLKYQNMVIFQDGKALSAHIISSGKRGMETPQGQFSIHNKAPRVWSKKYSLFMPYWMAFLPSGEMGIHELPEWPGGYKEGASHLGIPVSHGCIRLGVGDAKQVYDWAEIGTPVIIHN